MLNVLEASIYAGVSKPTFRKANVPFSQGRKKSYKLYDPKILDEYFPDAPKIMPNKKPTGKNISVPVSEEEHEGIPEFKPDEAAQKAFDEIVDDLGEDYRTVHNGVIESLLLVQHTKRYYHKMVMNNPLSDWSKLLDQSIKQEISIFKVLGLTR